MPSGPDAHILDLLRRRGTVSSTDVAAALGVSRQAAHRRLRALADRRAIVSQGAGRSARWALPDASSLTFDHDTKGLEEDRVWADLRERLQGLRELGSEARAIAGYAFTEMLNNAIDHSGSERVRIVVALDDDGLTLEIVDAGVGAFARIQSAMDLESPLEALGELTKGKVTTMPERHTGEGVFFTSKAVDRFQMEANGTRWIVDNRRRDFAVESVPAAPGTRIVCRIGRTPLRPLSEVFQEYTDDFEFTRTRAVVRLFGMGVEFVSRSEAKRLVRGLERFREVVLDFDQVASIGQGFADEVFRVFARAHPEVQLTPVAMAPAVEFMVQRALRQG